jgi:hypothetical protein
MSTNRLLSLAGGGQVEYPHGTSLAQAGLYDVAAGRDSTPSP